MRVVALQKEGKGRERKEEMGKGKKLKFVRKE
jgi:hypothetical protein